MSDEITRSFFPSSLGQVHFLRAGSGGDMPVLLLHQTPRSTDEFAELLPLLASERAVIAMDNPGYGASDVPPRQPTVEEYADTVIELLDHLGVEKAHLVGHHTGAVLAVDLAARRPERVGKLVLSGPTYLDGETREMLRSISKQWRVRPDGSHMSEKWEKFAGWTGDPHLVNRVVTDLLRAGETSEFGHFSCAEYRMEDTLPKVQGPALLVVGSRDAFANQPKNEIFAQVIPDVRRETIEEGGVFLPNEKPAELARLILDFL